jgi:pimeloyl-ACP methyl ester carboxylesterase
VETVRTEVLEIAYEQGGPEDGSPVLLLHGWPDAPRGFDALLPQFHDAGFRTFVPFLRGFGATQFISDETPRVGGAIALAQDAIDLADALGLDQFAVVGHDWGARTAYTLAALFPERLTNITALALGYEPRGESKVPSFEQSQRFWYQWFMCTDGGAAKVQEDPIGFARIQWGSWSPADWFDDAEFAETARAFENPDWVAITLNSYRSRWREGEAKDSRYQLLAQKLQKTEKLSTPTLMIQGASDTCDAPSESEGRERYFTGGYRRVLLDGVGHFPHREAHDSVAEAILGHLRA